VGKNKEKDPLDEALDESFPASDPPSWTASPPAMTPPAKGLEAQAAAAAEKLQRGATAMARQLGRISPDSFLWTGLALGATSLGLLLAGRRKASLVTGMWMAPVLLAGLYARNARSASVDPGSLH